MSETFTRTGQHTLQRQANISSHDIEWQCPNPCRVRSSTQMITFTSCPSSVDSANVLRNRQLADHGGYWLLCGDQVSSSLSSELRQAQEESLQSLVRNSQTLQHQRHRQQHLIQGQPQGGAQGLGRLSGRGQHPHRFNSGAPLSDGSSSNPMSSLLQSFQVSLPESIPLPNRTMISRPGMMISMPHLGAPGHQEGLREYQAALHGRNPIQKTAMCTSSKASFNVITSTGGSGSVAASVASEPVDLSHVLNPVIHEHLRSYPVPEPQHHPKVGRPHKKTPEQNNSFSPVAMEAHTRFRSPRRGAHRRQLDDAEVREQAGVWRNDELLQRLSLAQSRNITCPERLKGQVHLGPQDPTPLQFPASLYAHRNGSSGGINSAGLPGSSSSAPSDPHLPKDYSNYNGHLNGHLNGNQYNGHYNGHQNGSLSSMENRRSGDIPSTEGLQFHHRPRTQADCPGEPLWSQDKGFLSWSGKMGIQGNIYPPGMMNGMQGKVESEKFQRTLTEDLETLHKANKITSNGGKQNDHLEAAIQDDNCDLDKMMGNISQRERQVKTPKPKRRKISR
ncbi:hypothetical protein UPYG_G00315230 [Umbra pygmaea]|uniref:Uncharacterized protein n=1 Tax=Umbra pygmaea TaxID=75934 RepID=A0ABD0W433_UMBPY